MHVSLAVNLTAVVLPEAFRRLMAFRSDLLHHPRAPILREKYEAVSGGENE